MIKYRITGQQLAALRIVSLTPDVSLGDLSRRMYLHTSTCSGIVDRLEKKLYLTRTRSNLDRRVVHLRVTSEGRRVVKRTPEVGYGVLLQDIDKLPRGEVHRIWETMKVLMRVMRIAGDVARSGGGRPSAAEMKDMTRRRRPNYGG
jgi:DNA-binding MarR family transcriptional regulator